MTLSRAEKLDKIFGTPLFAVLLAIFWGINGWAQSMGVGPCAVSLARWYGFKERGTFYAIWSTAHNIGEAMTYMVIAAVIAGFGWQMGYLSTAALGAAGVVLLLIAAMLAASQFVRFGIPGWQLAERDRGRGEEGQPVVLSEARNGDMAFFLYQEGSSLRYTYYENEPGLDFGYHFRASGTGHEETGGYVVQHGETLLVVSLNRVEEVEGIEVTDPESGTVRQTYPVAPGEPFAVLVTLGEGAEDLALRAVDRRGETVPFENYYVR